MSTSMPVQTKFLRLEASANFVVVSPSTPAHGSSLRRETLAPHRKADGTLAPVPRRPSRPLGDFGPRSSFLFPDGQLHAVLLEPVGHVASTTIGCGGAPAGGGTSSWHRTRRWQPRL